MNDPMGRAAFLPFDGGVAKANAADESETLPARLELLLLLVKSENGGCMVLLEGVIVDGRILEGRACLMGDCRYMKRKKED